MMLAQLKDSMRRIESKLDLLLAEFGLSQQMPQEVVMPTQNAPQAQPLQLSVGMREVKPSKQVSQEVLDRLEKARQAKKAKQEAERAAQEDKEHQTPDNTEDQVTEDDDEGGSTHE